MNPAFTSNPIYFAWPFWVLELTPSASNSDIEKAAREIESKIQFQIPGADSYPSPLGKQTRDSYTLREAKTALQDPCSRVVAEYWYCPPDAGEENSSPAQTTGDTSPSTPSKVETVNLAQTRSVDAINRSLGVTFWE